MLGFLTCSELDLTLWTQCKVSSKLIENCDRRRVNRQTEKQHTDASEFIICPMLCYSNGQINKILLGPSKLFYVYEGLVFEMLGLAHLTSLLQQQCTMLTTLLWLIKQNTITYYDSLEVHHCRLDILLYHCSKQNFSDTVPYHSGTCMMLGNTLNIHKIHYLN